MLALVGSYLKSKLTSPVIYLVIGLVAFLALFVFYNSDTILDRFGFETKASLKAELAKSQKDLERANYLLQNQTLEAERAKAEYEKRIVILENVTKSKERVTATVTSNISKKTAKAETVKASLDTKIVTTETTITLPIAELDQLSTINITALHDAFNELGFNTST